MEPVRHDSDEPYALGWQLAALVLFVVVGLLAPRWFLNGVTGPLFLVFVLYLVPLWLRRLVRIGRGR